MEKSVQEIQTKQMLNYTEASVKQLRKTQTTLQIIQDFLFFILVLMAFIFGYAITDDLRVGAAAGLITAIALWFHATKQRDTEELY